MIPGGSQVFDVPGGSFLLSCQGGAGVHALSVFRNLSGGALSVWGVRETTSAMNYVTLADQDATNASFNVATDGPERVTIQYSGPTVTGEVDIWMRYDGTNCRFAVHTGASHP